MLVFLFVVFSLLFVFQDRFLLFYGSWLSSSLYQGQADIVIVQNPHNGRLETAIEMYLDDEVDTIITVATSSYLVRKKIEKKIIDQSSIFVGECLSYTTFSDAVNAKDAIEKNNLEGRKIVVVTDKYAARRMQWIFQKILGDKYEVSAVEAIHPNPARHQALTEPYWWRNRLSRRYVIAETQKNVFYRLYYGALGKEKELDIPFYSVSDWFSDWRVRDSQVRAARQVEAKEHYVERCNKR